MSSWNFITTGTEAKCNQHRYKLPGRCDGIKCLNFCIKQKYQDGTCGFTGNPGEILCYCISCDAKTSVDQLAVPLEGDKNVA